MGLLHERGRFRLAAMPLRLTGQALHQPLGSLPITPGTDATGTSGAWVVFEPGAEPVFVAGHEWVGFDLDGTLSRTDNPGHFDPPYPLGEPVPAMLGLAKALLEAGVRVKIFSARACEPASIPGIQAWAERHGLGRLEVTNRKDYDLIRFYDDRAIQVVENAGLSAAWAALNPTAVPVRVLV